MEVIYGYDDTDISIDLWGNGNLFSDFERHYFIEDEENQLCSIPSKDEQYQSQVHLQQIDENQCKNMMLPTSNIKYYDGTHIEATEAIEVSDSHATHTGEFTQSGVETKDNKEEAWPTEITELLQRVHEVVPDISVPNDPQIKASAHPETIKSCSTNVSATDLISRHTEGML